MSAFADERSCPKGFSMITRRHAPPDCLLSLLGQQLLEMSEGFSLRKIRSHVVHAIGEPCPRGSVDPANRRQRLYHFGQALGPLFGGLVAVIDPNNSEPIRKLAGLYQMVERRHDETLGQIPTSAENYQGCGLWLATRRRLRRSFCAFG